MLMRKAGFVVLLVCLLSGAAFAQALSLSGRVVDPRGGAVGDAVVTLSPPTGPAVRTARTTPDGTFELSGVSAGSYVLRVESPGFQGWTRTIAIGPATAPLSVVLQIAAVTEDVAVVAPRLEEELPQEIERAGTRMQTITAVQIEHGGYDDVGQALQALVPGLFLAPQSGAFDYVSAALQGSRTNEILWLVDGVRISNRLYNDTTPLDTLPAHMVERIEVLEGGQGLFYGTQAVAGVVNVVTRSFTEATDGRLQTAFDTNKGRHVNLFARDSRNGHRFVFYGSSDQAEGYNSFPESEYQPSTSDRHRSYDVLTAGAKYAYDFTQNLRVSGMYQRSDVSLDTLRPARSSATQIGGPATRFNDREEHIASGKLDYTPNGTIQLFTKGYYHRWDSFYNESRNSIDDPGTRQVVSVDEFWGYKDYGLNLLTRITPTRELEYFAGYDYQNYSGRDDVLLIAPASEKVNAVFGQVRTTRALLPKAMLAAGVRFNAPTNAQNSTVWNVSGRYDFTGQLFARANVGTSFRYPDAYQLFAIDDTCCIGNPNLKPETSTNVNGSFGVSARSGDRTFNVEIIGFYRLVDDLIIGELDENDLEVPQNSEDTVRVKGVSFVGSTALGLDLSASLGYTYTKAQGRSGTAGGYSVLPGIPSNHVQATVDYHPRSLPFGAKLAINGVGETFDIVSGFGDVPSGDYLVADLSGRVYLDGQRRHRIGVRLENLFNEEYATIHRRMFTDAGQPFLSRNLGPERTLHVSYGFSF
jgi:vitamin B12 transporter